MLTIPTLENWEIRSLLINLDKRVAIVSGKLNGEVKKFVIVRKFDPVNEILTIASDTEFRLGNPHPDYEKKFPNARFFFLEGLKKRYNVQKS